MWCGVVQMGLETLLVFCLLLGTVSPLRDVHETTSSSCSSKLQAAGLHDHRQHLNSSGLHLPLHHVRSPCSPVSMPDLSPSDILRHDALRVEALNTRLSSAPEKKKTPSSSFTSPESLNVPLKPGESLGVGNYVASIGLGTPAKDYAIVIDTGSSLSWMQCAPCLGYCHPQVGAVFDPSASTTYRQVPCSTPECQGLESATLNPSSCSRTKVCIYEASYGDSSFSIGYLSKDTLSLSGSPAISAFVYGCGQYNKGLFGRTAGIVGLARNKLSMFSQLAPKYGYAFSYCLPTTSGSGYLSLGGSHGSKTFSFTPMLTSSKDATLYYLGLAGMSVGQKPLAVSPAAYKSLPTLIDSGTVITRLPAQVYAALSQAVAGALANYPRAPAFSNLDTCFKGSYEKLPVPEVTMVFAGGAQLRLSPHNVFYDFAASVTCLAFARAGSVAIIGNRQQQTFTVAYDVAGSKIGFAAGGCG